MADPLERLQRIAEAHHKDVDSHGGTWGICIECDRIWPCPTYVWASDQTRDGLSTWDPDDDGDEPDFDRRESTVDEVLNADEREGIKR